MAKKAQDHIWSVAVQDLRTSHIRARALRLRRPDLWLLYLELMLALKENGGTLPADPAALVDDVVFWTEEQLAEMIPLLKPSPTKRGGIETNGETLFQPRISQEDEERLAFSQVAAELGKQRAATASRGPDGRMLAKVQPAASAPPATTQRPPATTRAAKPVQKAPPPPQEDSAPASEPPADVQTPLEGRLSESSIPSPFPLPSTGAVPSHGSTNAAAAGNVAREATPDPARTPLLDHDANAPLEVELVELCRTLVTAGIFGDDYAALRTISRTAKGKSIDMVWGVGDGWARRSIAEGKAMLANSSRAKPGNTPGETRLPPVEERRAAMRAGLAQIADVVLKDGKALVAPAEPDQTGPEPTQPEEER
jgi:hypothetical protein